MKLQTVRNLAIGTLLALPATVLNISNALAGPQDFMAVNNNDLVVTNLYVSSSKSDDWGRDRLQDAVLKSGSNFAIEFNNNSPQCLWDVKAVYEDGSYDVGQYNLCETTAVEFYGHGGEYR